MHTVYQSYRYAVGNRVMTLWANVLYDAAMTDIHTCLKLVPLPFFRGLRLRQRGFGLDTELAAGILAAGGRPFEVPVAYYSRSHEDGKKITWRDGVECLWILARSRLRRRGRHAVPTPRVWTPAKPVAGHRHRGAVPSAPATGRTAPRTTTSSPRSSTSRARLPTHARAAGAPARDRLGAGRRGRAGRRRPAADPAGRSHLDAIGATGSSDGFTELAMARAPRRDGVGLDARRRVRDLRSTTSRAPIATTAGQLVTTAAEPTGSLRRERHASRSATVRSAPSRCAPPSAATTAPTRVWVGARVDPEPAQSVGTWLACPGAPP